VANLPLGVTELSRFDQGQIRVRRGDRLLLYTDGVVEAPDKSGHLFGAERLLDVLQRTAGSPSPTVKQAVLSAVRAHTCGPLNHSDCTVLVIEIDG
jgi:serine phosphatase RsbU (regulator of sigma subunit)